MTPWKLGDEVEVSDSGAMFRVNGGKWRPVTAEVVAALDSAQAPVRNRAERRAEAVQIRRAAKRRQA